MCVQVFQVIYSFHAFETKICVRISNTPSILYLLIWTSSQYLTKCKNYRTFFFFLNFVIFLSSCHDVYLRYKYFTQHPVFKNPNFSSYFNVKDYVLFLWNLVKTKKYKSVLASERLNLSQVDLEIGISSETERFLRNNFLVWSFPFRWCRDDRAESPGGLRNAKNPVMHLKAES